MPGGTLMFAHSEPEAADVEIVVRGGVTPGANDEERAELMSLRVTRFVRYAAGLCTGRIPPTPEMIKVTMALARARRRAARAAEARVAATAKRKAIVRRLSRTFGEGEDEGTVENTPAALVGGDGVASVIASDAANTTTAAAAAGGVLEEPSAAVLAAGGGAAGATVLAETPQTAVGAKPEATPRVGAEAADAAVQAADDVAVAVTAVPQTAAGAKPEATTVAKGGAALTPTPRSPSSVAGNPKKNRTRRLSSRLLGAVTATRRKTKRNVQKMAAGYIHGNSERRLQLIVQCLQLLCVCYAALVLLPTWQPGGATEYATNSHSVRLCPRANICSEGIFEVTMIVVARLSAWYMVPPIVFIFLSKCRVLTAYTSATSLSLWLPLNDLHELHATLGKTTGWMTVLHTLAHLARWGTRGEMSKLYDGAVGRSGVIGALATAPVVLLMGVRALRKKYSWELRINVHKIGALCFLVGLAFHTSKLTVIMTALLAAWAIDSFVTSHYLTHKVTSSKFNRLGSGTQLTFSNHQHWATFGAELGYIRVCVPWVSKSQWHPFSVYPAADDPENKSAVFIVAAGDWTEALHRSIERDTQRPVWIQGPFPSPYAAAMTFQNLLLVATGIGITPAVACLQNYKEERQCNLIWCCRDAALVQFYVHNIEFDDDGFTLIYYTGKTPLQIDIDIPDNMRIMQRRPKLVDEIPAIIESVETGVRLPESFLTTSDTSALEAKLEHADSPKERVDILLLECLEKGMSAEDILSLFEPDAAGTLAPNLFDIGLRKLSSKWLSFNPEELEAVIAHFDDDGDGDIDQAEWMEYVTNLKRAQKIKGSFQESTPPLERFRLFALHCLGSMSKEQILANFVPASGAVSELFSATALDRGLRKMTNGLLALSPGELNELLVAVDEDGDGATSYIEWGKYLGKIEEEAAQQRVCQLAASKRAAGRDSRTNVGWRPPQADTEATPAATQVDNMHLRFRKRSSAAAEQQQTMAFMDGMSPSVRKGWGMFYCGGSMPVIRQLRAVSSKHRITLKEESFEW
jgi:predicted ferric reductase/Ca2+-binding EF-hand superfamily protein